MKPIILLTSTQYPGYGGAATNTYALIKYLKKEGYNVFGIFFENSDVNVDPADIGNIIKMECRIFESHDTKRLDIYRQKLKTMMRRDPHIIFSKNYKAPTYCKTLYPNAKNIYLVSGINHCPLFFPDKCAQHILKNETVIPDFPCEIKTMELCDLAVTNSLISLKMLCKIYPQFIEKIYPFPIDTTKEINLLLDTNKCFEKKYDFMIAASVLTRSEKNNLFLIDILKDRVFDKYTKIIIGGNNHHYKDIPNSVFHDMLPHKELMNFMRETKVLLYPSLNDANPNTVREALHNKCLVLISNNIGYYEKFPEFSVCSTYNKNEWIHKSLHLIKNYDNIIEKYQIDFGTDENIIDLINKLT